MTRRLIATLSFLACFLGNCLSYGQHENGETANKPIPLCDPAAIDTTFTFRDEPVGEQTVSLYFLNKGNATCRLKDPSYQPDGGRTWKETGTILAPGGTTAADVNWASTGESCKSKDWTNFFFVWTELNDASKYTYFFFHAADWPLHFCSPERSFGYRLAKDGPSYGPQKADPALLISLKQEPVYSDERATLHVLLAESAQAGEKSVGCASLYMIRHNQLDSLRAMGSFRRECSIPAGALSADAEVDAKDLPKITHIEWRTAPASGKDPNFFIADTHFTVLDVDTLAPNWGEPVHGIRAGLSVDRAKFGVGEPVPIHIRWENVNASAILGQGECREPLPDLEIQNSEHQVLKTIPTYEMCSGHGWGPFEIPKGTAQHEFRELTTSSPPSVASAAVIPPILPGAGIYYLVSIWSPSVLNKSETESNVLFPNAGRIGGVYATARSLPVRIEVGPGSNP